MRYPIYLHGFPDDPIRNVTVTDAVVKQASKPNYIQDAVGVKLRDVRVDGQ